MEEDIAQLDDQPEDAGGQEGGEQRHRLHQRQSQRQHGDQVVDDDLAAARVQAHRRPGEQRVVDEVADGEAEQLPREGRLADRGEGDAARDVVARPRQIEVCDWNGQC